MKSLHVCRHALTGCVPGLFCFEPQCHPHACCGGSFGPADVRHEETVLLLELCLCFVDDDVQRVVIAGHEAIDGEGVGVHGVASG